MDYYKKFKEQLGFVVWISDSGLVGKLENWFTHEIVFFHMSAFQHFTMMGGELFHYRDKNAGETYLTKGDVLVYEKGKGTEGKGPATLWFGSAEECTRLMREDHIAK